MEPEYRVKAVKFRKKPIVVEAVQWIGTGDSMDAIRALDPGTKVAVDFTWDNVFLVSDDCSQAVAEIGDWIVRDADDELYVCERDKFFLTHEMVGKE